MILLFKAMVSGYTRQDGTRVKPHIRADKFAATAHSGQFRSAAPGAPKIPYIEHPREVSKILRDVGINDEATLSAALLHDTIEDCGLTHAQLVTEFGAEVADLVVELTNDKTVPREGKTAAQVKKARTMSAKAAAIKIADKTANLRSILTSPPDWAPERKRKYFEDARQVVHSMAHKNAALVKIFDQIYNTGIAHL